MEKLLKTLFSKRNIQILVVVFFIATSLMGYSTTAKGNDAIHRVYHLYVDEQFIGTVEDTEWADAVIQQKQDAFFATTQRLKGTVKNEIVYIPEDVLGGNVELSDSVAVKAQLEKMISIETRVAAIMIEGEPVFLFEETADAEETLRRLKLQYVAAEDLTEEAQSRELAVGETKVASVAFDKKVDVREMGLAPERFYTVEEALQVIAHGTGEGPLIQVQVEKETLKELSIPYKTVHVDDKKMFKGVSKVTQKGAKGSKLSQQRIVEVDGKEIATEVVKETTTVQPTNKIVLNGTKVIASRGTGEMAWPTNGGYVSSFMGQRWGRLHKGIDIIRPSNLTIKASDNGVVTSAGWDNGGYGNKVVIDHKNGFQTLYAHLDKVDVKAGQVVQKGQALGIMGNTGRSFGTHLHFEMFKNGGLVNPMDHVKR